MKKFLKSFVYALNGIYTATVEQMNLKIQIAIGLLAVAAGVYFDITGIEWCVLLLTIALVAGMEMMNTALENVVNLITREHHPLAGKAKDIAAGAVLFASVTAAIVGVILFWKYLIS